MPQPKKALLLTGNCSHKSCKKRSTSAKKMTDFWIEYCDGHAGKPITIDMKKIGRYVHPEDLL